jgi:hypothetical protein
LRKQARYRLNATAGYGSRRGGDEIATRHLYAQGREQLSAERRAGFESNNRRTAMTIYWRFFNFLVRRIIAVSFAVGGVIVSLTHTGNKLLGLR